MLKLFEVSGFKNFKDKISLDFSDVREYKFNSSCITENTVAKMIIYGKNSIGKSNFGLAVFDIVSHLSSKNITPGLYDYYLNVEDYCPYAEFHYRFGFDSGEVDYIYRKDEKQTLTYETMSIDGKLLFEYDYVNRAGDLSGIHELAPTLNLSQQDVDSILRFTVNNTVMPEQHPLMQMMSYVNNMLWFRSLDENRFIGYKIKSNDYFDFIFEGDRLSEFETFINNAGINKTLKVMEDNDGRKRLYFNEKTPLPFFKVASSGTKALYTFFYWYKTAENVSMLFVDEFDAFYHYELAESIVGLLEKMKSVQVILTTHNTNLLTNRIMRPDCYFILTKDKITSFANATGRELREGHNLEKLFMSGEFDG